MDSIHKVINMNLSKQEAKSSKDTSNTYSKKSCSSQMKDLNDFISLMNLKDTIVEMNIIKP